MKFVQTIERKSQTLTTPGLPLLEPVGTMVDKI